MLMGIDQLERVRAGRDRVLVLLAPHRPLLIVLRCITTNPSTRQSPPAHVLRTPGQARANLVLIGDVVSA